MRKNKTKINNLFRKVSFGGVEFNENTENENPNIINKQPNIKFSKTIITKETNTPKINISENVDVIMKEQKIENQVINTEHKLEQITVPIYVPLPLPTKHKIETLEQKLYTYNKLSEITTIEKHNTKILLTLGSSILQAYKDEDDKMCIKPNFLEKHNIHINSRVKVIDWLLYITDFYNISEEATYLTVSIFDNYLNKVDNFDKKDIFLLVVTSLYIASKFEDIIPIRLSAIEKIANNSFEM